MSNPFNVQFTIDDDELAKALKHKAIELEDKIAIPGKRTGGSTLAKAIIEAVLRSGNLEEILGLVDPFPDRETPPSEQETPRTGKSGARKRTR